MTECPNPEFHGNPFRYCSCGWTEDTAGDTPEAERVPFAVESGWTRSEFIAHTLGPDYRLLFYPDDSVGFEHRCDRGDRGVIICAPRLKPEHTVTQADAKTTVSPSILCPDCGTHGFVRDGRWVAA